MGGAGLMRFFEDSSIGIKVSPIMAVVLSASLILIVLLAHLGVLTLIFSPLTGGGGAGGA
jgi:preprotein translocase subunit Sec61beta